VPQSWNISQVTSEKRPRRLRREIGRLWPNCESNWNCSIPTRSFRRVKLTSNLSDIPAGGPSEPPTTGSTSCWRCWVYWESKSASRRTLHADVIYGVISRKCEEILFRLDMGKLRSARNQIRLTGKLFWEASAFVDPRSVSLINQPIRYNQDLTNANAPIPNLAIRWSLSPA
jgi:hypothetical protein